MPTEQRFDFIGETTNVPIIISTSSSTVFNNDFQSSQGSIRIPEEVVETASDDDLVDAIRKGRQLLSAARLAELTKLICKSEDTPFPLKEEAVDEFLGLLDDTSQSDRDLFISPEAIRRARKIVQLGRVCQTQDQQRAEGKYVYLAVSESGKVKIGISISPEDRVSTIHSQSPVSVNLKHTFFADDALSAEGILHDVYEVKRTSGEWFDLSVEQIDFLCQIQKFEEGSFYDSDGHKIEVISR